jgi:hypothetical protein
MAEYIDRVPILQQLENTKINAQTVFINSILEGLLKKAPAADVVEVVHGEWIPIEADGYADGYPVWDLWECSECREEHRGDEDTLTPYCPNCGAKMDGKGDTDD